MTDSNRTAFLDMISACEGTLTDEGYRALFGYTPYNHRTFDNGFATHPNIKTPFVQTNGIQNFSTAAGRYQIIHSTFVELQTAMGSVDFSPYTQDGMALELIRRAGALPDIDAGNLQAAIDTCSALWASLPGSNYAQPKRSYDFAKAAYTDAGGTVA